MAVSDSRERPGTGDIAASAAELSAFVDRVLAATGASKVDIVGHSQGGVIPGYYLAVLGGAAKVATLVGLAPSNHGTTLWGLARLATFYPWTVGFVVGAWCPACLQQIAGSAFLDHLNAGGDTVPGVEYTVIETRYDEIVTPYRSAELQGPDVTNIRLQDDCRLDHSEHLSITFDHIARATRAQRARSRSRPGDHVPLRATDPRRVSGSGHSIGPTEVQRGHDRRPLPAVPGTPVSRVRSRASPTPGRRPRAWRRPPAGGEDHKIGAGT